MIDRRSAHLGASLVVCTLVASVAAMSCAAATPRAETTPAPRVVASHSEPVLEPAASASEPPPKLPTDGPGWMGVALESAEGGVLVGKVVRRSPAAQGGLRAGDLVVSVDGQPPENARALVRRVASSAPGARLALSVRRGASTLALEVVLSGRPEPDDILRLDMLGAPAPAWRELTALGGASTELAGYRGRVVVLDFWATWCGPCRFTLPRLRALHGKHVAEGLSIVGISTEDADKVATFGVSAALPYALAVDPAGKTSRTYGVSSLPSMFLIDRAGVIRDVFVGVPSPEVLETRVAELLREPPPRESKP